MKPVVDKQKTLSILYDASLMELPTEDFFSVEYWKSRKALNGEAVGRGSAWFLDTPFGPVVLRQYLRGGWVAGISHRSYLFTTVSRSRPFVEFRVLSTLFEQGLPVPRPLAALCRHRGFSSTGAIMTARISSAQTLAELLPGQHAGPEVGTGIWERVGKCIRRFHAAGVWHADLNARNILLDDGLQVFLIDFDRARLTSGKAVDGKDNLKRLKRSLIKLWPVDETASLQSAWVQLLAGYHG